MAYVEQRGGIEKRYVPAWPQFDRKWFIPTGPLNLRFHQILHILYDSAHLFFVIRHWNRGSSHFPVARLNSLVNRSMMMLLMMMMMMMMRMIDKRHSCHVCLNRKYAAKYTRVHVIRSVICLQSIYNIRVVIICTVQSLLRKCLFVNSFLFFEREFEIRTFQSAGINQ